MPRFAPGDKAVVNGMNVTIRSWPENDTGPFVVEATMKDGGEVLATHWVANTDVDPGQMGLIAPEDVTAGDGGAEPEFKVAQEVVVNEKPGVVQADTTGVAT